ncbi:aggregation-promoting factor C-terminal-like domain-containing protein [Frigoribacterium salinisoli]
MVDSPAPCRLPRSGTGRGARAARATATALVLALGASVLGTTPAPAAERPSWDDVRAARGDAAATQRQVDAVEAALDDLEATAAARGRSAVTAGAEAAEARTALAAATADRDRLAGDADRAAERADEAARSAGQLSAQLYRTGGARSLGTGLVGSDDAGDVLYRLGALTQLGDRWQGVLVGAQVAQGTASSLRDRAAAAAGALERAAAEADRSAAEAADAQRAADAEVTTAQDEGAELYAQLAELKQTSVDVEQQYRAGVAAERAYAEQAAAAAAAAAGTSGGDAASGTVVPPVAAPPPAAPPASAPPAPAPSTSRPAPPPVAPPAPAPVAPPVAVVDDPAGAKAYARSALTARGQGGDQYTCLVQLWNRESGWRTGATNPSSGAYGIPQAYPGSQMASAGLDWRTNPRTQVDWGLGYIRDRYVTACAAWDHSNRKGWY